MEGHEQDLAAPAAGHNLDGQCPHGLRVAEPRDRARPAVDEDLELLVGAGAEDVQVLGDARHRRPVDVVLGPQRRLRPPAALAQPPEAAVDVGDGGPPAVAQDGGSSSQFEDMKS